MSFGCERRCLSSRRVSNFNSNVPQGGYLSNIFRVRALTSSGSTGGRGGDANHNITKHFVQWYNYHNAILQGIQVKVNPSPIGWYVLYTTIEYQRYLPLYYILSLRRQIPYFMPHSLISYIAHPQITSPAFLPQSPTSHTVFQSPTSHIF